MDSIAERCAQQFVTLINDPDDKPAELNVHRNRTLPFDEDQLPAAVIYLGNEVIQPAHGKEGKVSEHLLPVSVEIRVADDTPDVALDPYIVWANRAIMSDPKLGGYAITTMLTGISRTAELLDKSYGGARMDFLVQFRARKADLTTRV